MFLKATTQESVTQNISFGKNGNILNGTYIGNRVVIKVNGVRGSSFLWTGGMSEIMKLKKRYHVRIEITIEKRKACDIECVEMFLLNAEYAFHYIAIKHFEPYQGGKVSILQLQL